MASFKFKGLDEYVRTLEHLESSIDLQLGEAIYKGADIVANAVKEGLRSLPVDNRLKAEQKTSITKVQKQGLIESFGVARLQNDNGYRNVKLGFDGYNKVVTKKFPKGQPNVMIARTLESGTSFMQKNRVISKATNSSKKACEEAMAESLDKAIAKIMK